MPLPARWSHGVWGGGRATEGLGAVEGAGSGTSSVGVLKEGTPNRFWEMEASSSPIPGEQTLAGKDPGNSLETTGPALASWAPRCPPVMGVVGAVLTPAGSREPFKEMNEEQRVNHGEASLGPCRTGGQECKSNLGLIPTPSPC